MQFKTIHADVMGQLKGEYGKKVTKGFPPKKFIHNLSPASVDRRHQQLQDWLQTILNDKLLVSATALQLFIKAGKEDADFVPRQLASTIESDIDMATTLYKYAGGKWKDRWFVLRHGRLYKYNSPQAKHPYGFYDLRQARATALSDMTDFHLKNAKNFAFVVQSASAHEEKETRYIFSATTEDIMKGWISCINQEFSKAEHNKVFGVPISEVRDRDANGVPLFLSALLTFLEATALKEEELFTKPPDEEIKRAIDRGKTVDIAKVAEDAHAVAGLIVQYLHELPDAIIPEDICPSFYGIFEIKDVDKRMRMLAALSEILPIINRNLLIKVFSFLHHASRGAVKRERLSKIFGRIIFRVAGDHQLDLSGITEQLIEHWDVLVVADEVYAAPEKILVVKKKKSSKSNKAAVSTKLTEKESKPTTTVISASPKDTKPVHNDYYDSNEELEESSEEEEWTDDEVQVISEISEYSSEEEYEEDEEDDESEEEYDDEELIDELAKAAADIPEIEPALPTKSKQQEEEEEAALAAAKAAQEVAEKEKAELEALEKEMEKVAQAQAKAKAELEALEKEKAEQEALEKEKAEKKAQRKAEKAAAAAAAATAISDEAPTTPKKHKKEKSTMEKTEEPSAAITDSPSASGKKKSKKDVTKSAATEAAPGSLPASAFAAAAHSADETTAPASEQPKRIKKTKSVKKKNVKTEPRRPSAVETIAGVQTSALPPPLSLQGVTHEDQPLGSPTHEPLTSPNIRRPKKTQSQVPSHARSPHVPAQRAPEPALSPQEQLVADLGKVLGRRPVGGVALFPVMPVKK